MATETVSNRTYAILFTDGRFNDTMNTISSANELKNNKATIIVIREYLCVTTALMVCTVELNFNDIFYCLLLNVALSTTFED